jgi:arylformamidase
MKINIENIGGFDTSKPIDISLQLVNNELNPRAWYVGQPSFDPVMENGFIGSVALGGSVNFRNIYFNPHGHGTHTECVGHISEEVYSVNSVVKDYFFLAQVITVSPEEILNELDGLIDRVVTSISLAHIKIDDKVECVVIRTLPNDTQKKFKNYSNTNPPYLHIETADILAPQHIKHLMIDMPSVDRESDEGKLAFHNKFWNTHGEIRMDRTITEFIFVPDHVNDGIYIMNLQMAPLENDAAPSRPVLYEIQ